ncbi:hypothetical protein WJX72_007808 [[Myrmecia] bisecta]|uniref:Uncharacterized protein n=1 Tax=[Myrmecia] bisecta TaxID=41462 RepID=A0AAW1QRJ2_9CHLO
MLSRLTPSVQRCFAACSQAVQHAGHTLPADLMDIARVLTPALVHTCGFHSSSWRGFADLAVAAHPPVYPRLGTPLLEEDNDDEDEQLTPKQVVEKLDRFIVGQADAKRAVANALRNRWRRHRIPSPLKEEIVPKNILMIGPTGCGKTEIARRLAKLADAPFVKVEATKFTEVGFHGRDVDQIIRDLVDNAMVMTRHKLQRKMKKAIELALEEKLLDLLMGKDAGDRTREEFRRLMREGALEDRKIAVEVPNNGTRPIVMGSQDGFSAQAVQNILIAAQEATRSRYPQKREMKISEARPLLEEQEAEQLISPDTIQREALQSVEQDGIVFIDEIDKIVNSHEHHYGADASSEGVQRDLLPIIEGSVVSTKYGNVNTDHILFICSGAFHSCKPSDMLAELQGRLPIRVELKGLTANDFYRILTEPEHNMIKQQVALMETEGVQLQFTDDGIREVARVAEEVNTSVDNIGARRLHTVLERIVEEISFHAPEKAKEATANGGNKYTEIVDRALVIERVGDLLKKQDLSKYVL